MPDITMYVPAGAKVSVHEGDPPEDQSAKIAVLVDQIAQITAQRDANATERDGLAHRVAELQGRIAKATTDLNG